MPSHPLPPFDPVLWLQACQQTWWAGIDPPGIGRWWRQQRLTRLIAFAQAQSPLYARRSRGARTLADFEPVGKAELMQHFDDWATDRRITREAAERHLASAAGVADAWLDRYLLWTSSGTSGQPGLFVQDAASLAAYDAIEALRQGRPVGFSIGSGARAAGRRLAYVGAIGGPYAGHVGMERLRRLLPAPWAPQIRLISVLEPIERIARELDALQPDVLVTYPSCGTALAAVQAAGRMSLNLQQLWLGGEQLSAAQRRLLGAAFGCPLHNHYGASEFFSIASECHHGRLHLNDDWVMLEGLDAQRHPVAPAEFSQLTLLTHLANFTQPLLRYELTDRVRFVAEACPCGSAFPVIEVQGRCDDTLLLPGLRHGQVALLPLALETLLEERCGVSQFQLLRRTDASLELRLADSGSGPSSGSQLERCGQVLTEWLQEQRAQPQHLVLNRLAPMRDLGSGKLRRVIDLGSAGTTS